MLLVPQMQQAELEQERQREANLTALAAIGPRKKRKVDGSDGVSLSSYPRLYSVEMHLHCFPFSLFRMLLVLALVRLVASVALAHDQR